MTKPLIETAEEIEVLAIKANAIYINPKTQSNEEYLDALKSRGTMLGEILQEMKVFDVLFDRLIRQIGIEKSDTRHMIEAIRSIIEREAGKDEKLKCLEVKVIMQGDGICLATADGKETVKYRLTESNKRAWLETRNRTRTLVSERLSSDRVLYKKVHSRSELSSANPVP